MFDERDAIEQDMAAHQRRFSGEVTALDNQALAAQALEQLDNAKRDEKPLPAPPVEAPSFTGERDGEHGVYLLGQASTDDVRTRRATAPEAWFMLHAMPRLEKLLAAKDTGPLGAASWHTRLLAVLALQSEAASFRAQGLDGTARDRERRYMFELIQLLDDSDAVFKPSWKADIDDRKIRVTVL